MSYYLPAFFHYGNPDPAEYFIDRARINSDASGNDCKLVFFWFHRALSVGPVVMGNSQLGDYGTLIMQLTQTGSGLESVADSFFTLPMKGKNHAT